MPEPTPTHQADNATERASASADAWRARLALVEQGARLQQQERALGELLRSRSWRITAPLRRLLGWVAPRSSFRPPLQPSQSGEVQPLAQRLIDLVGQGEAPAWMVSGAEHGAQRLLVDVTELALEDLGGGVQRVTRQVLRELFEHPGGFAIEPVRVDSAGRYAHARAFAAEWLGFRAGALGLDVPVRAGPDDLLLGLDFCRPHVDAFAAALSSLRSQGALVALLAHDALPAEHPEWFPAGVPEEYEAWLACLSQHADLVIANSMSTAQSLQRVLEARRLKVPDYGIDTALLGADALSSPVSTPSPLPPKGNDVLRVLMVGTVEPRKGHAQALLALEQMWSRGGHVELVIVGREGWNSQALCRTLRQHPELHHRLHWLESLADSSLEALYQESDVLLAASQGEGFGLPVVEAGRLGCGLVLRDIPVFREVAGSAARYFMGDSAEAIAAALSRWRQGDRGSPSQPWPTWRQTTQAMLASCRRTILARSEKQLKETL